MKIIIILLITGFPLLSFAQITGIGIFRIDKTTTSVIDTIIKNSYSSYYDTASYINIVHQFKIQKIDKYFHEDEVSTDTIYELKGNKENILSPTYAPIMKNERVFFIKNYNVVLDPKKKK